MLRRIESRTGRSAALIGLFLAVTAIMCVPVGLLGASNLVWGAPNQDGRVPIPGSTVLRLPSGTIDVAAAVYVVGKGNQSVDLRLPANLSLAVAPVDSAAVPAIDRAVGASGNADANGANTQRRVWKLQIPTSGRYRVTAGGTFAPVGIHAQLWLGHGPPIPGILVPAVAAGIALVLGVVWAAVAWAIRHRARHAELVGS